MPTSATPSPRILETLSPEGLPLLSVSGDFGSARFSPQGAHLLNFTPKGQPPLLFLSSSTFLAPGKAIRGGVPVIFPWFGPRAGHPEAPMHGLVRTRLWQVDRVDVPEKGPATVRFSFLSSAETLALWPHSFALSLEFVLGAALEIHWEVQNTGNAPFQFEQALHPYFPIQDVHSASVSGLRGAHYLDKTDALRLKEDDAPCVSFTGEVDRLYLDTKAECVLSDPASGRTLVVSKTGSNSSVVWNPWSAKAAALPDLGDEDWRHFVCVEQVNAAENAVLLPPGASHFLTTKYDFSNSARP
ncbi:MAG: glucose-6-phosphate 1-epimerase [Verrucomicrobia bacterium]|nr:MAG: glucose-6-phosphate 1-epimerase [Verrucomicrobiota bacterium]